jgi:hypothetical protein
MNKRLLLAWLGSLLLAAPVTFVIFWLLDIPFFGRATGYTVISILLLAFFISFILDTLLNIGVNDERGWHLGFYDPMGPLGSDDPPPPDGYQPIVSREERLKQEQGGATSPAAPTRTRARRTDAG